MYSKKLIISAVVAMSATSGIGAAYAADLPARTYSKAPVMVADPVYNWTGFYVGGSVGADWQRANSQYTDVGGFGGPVAILFAPATTTQRGTGFIGGMDAGYNFQAGQFVYGIEGDVSWVNARGTDFTSPSPLVFTNTNTTNTSWLGTLRARAGFLAAPQTLIFATGGLAVGGVSGTTHTERVPSCAAIVNTYCADGSASSTRAGWTAGAGLEQAFGSQWSVKLEYLYYDLGTFSFTGKKTNNLAGAVGTPIYSDSTSVTGQIARVGFNYRFGGR